MFSRLNSLAFGLTLILLLAGCDSPQVEESDPFRTRAQSPAAAPPAPTAAFDSGVPASVPVADGSTPEGRAASSLPASTSTKNTSTAKKSGSPTGSPTVYDVVGEEVIIDPDSHRGRSKKRKERLKAAETNSAESPDDKDKKS